MSSGFVGAFLEGRHELAGVGGAAAVCAVVQWRSAGAVVVTPGWLSSVIMVVIVSTVRRRSDRMLGCSSSVRLPPRGGFLLEHCLNRTPPLHAASGRASRLLAVPAVPAG